MSQQSPVHWAELVKVVRINNICVAVLCSHTHLSNKQVCGVVSKNKTAQTQKKCATFSLVSQINIVGLGWKT